jgi:hypothetical protein
VSVRRCTRGGARALLGAAWVLAGCATAGAPPAENLGNPDVILVEEIQASNSRSVYELVQTRRPQWFVLRGMTTLAQAAGEEDIMVYLNNAHLGFRDALLRVPLAGVEYVQFFSAREATQRWGGGHLHGAILVSTQRRGP